MMTSDERVSCTKPGGPLMVSLTTSDMRKELEEHYGAAGIPEHLNDALKKLEAVEQSKAPTQQEIADARQTFGTVLAPWFESQPKIRWNWKP
jgi:hypothetical protein